LQDYCAEDGPPGKQEIVINKIRVPNSLFPDFTDASGDGRSGIEDTGVEVCHIKRVLDKIKEADLTKTTPFPTCRHSWQTGEGEEIAETTDVVRPKKKFD